MKQIITKYRASIQYLKDHKKQLFWVWISYHIIKGLLTTSLIWIPLIYSLSK